MVDFNAARSKLNISQEQFHALDRLDGNFDGNMEESIFSQAELYRQSQTAKYKVPPYDPLSINKIDSKIKEILDRGITYWNKVKPGTMEFSHRGDMEIDTKMDAARAAHNGICDEDGNLVKFDSTFFGGIANAIIEFSEYYLENGKLDGCKALKKLPDGAEFVSFDFEYDYDILHGRKNDEEDFTGDMPVYQRNPDKTNVSLTFSYQGKKYTFYETYDIKMKQP